MSMHPLAKRLFDAERNRPLPNTPYIRRKLKHLLSEANQARYQQLLKQLMEPNVRERFPKLRDADVMLFAQAGTKAGNTLDQTMKTIEMYHDYFKQDLILPQPPKPAIDGSEVHYLTWEPPTERSRYIAGMDCIDGANNFTVVLREEFYKPGALEDNEYRQENGNVFYESECVLVAVEPHPSNPEGPAQLRIRGPWGYQRELVEAWYLDTADTWKYFPKIAKKLGRVS